MVDVYKISPADNVAVALKDLPKGSAFDLDGRRLELKEDAKRGFKIALSPIAAGENVVKYGAPIGHATAPIGIGEIVHVQNVKTNIQGICEYSYHPRLQKLPYGNRNLTIRAYRRKNGAVGIRNELWVVPTVGCVNTTAERIVRRFREMSGDTETAIQIFRHNYGCSQLSDDFANTVKILGDVVRHPNAGGVLVLGLGCESNGVENFRSSLGNFDSERVRFLICQQVADEVEEGAKLLSELYRLIKQDRRESVPFSELKVGLKCGGSDGMSGITANPLVGKFADFLVAQGGTAVMAEVPEMFGAETLLMNRAKNEDVFRRTVSLINDFKEYFIQYNLPLYENPSPGNKAGGITTLEDKSLGCVQKSGTSAVTDVLRYGETLRTEGLNLLNSPGNDMVSTTALAASGCQMLLFTTGRGTPFGSFVPTVKISSNSALYAMKRGWIDFDAGCLAEGTPTDQVLDRLVDFITEVANGEKTCNEKNGYQEMAIFKTGVTL